MEEKECQEDFNLKDYKVNKVSLWEKLDKKKFLIIVVILLLILLIIISTILIVVSVGGKKEEELLLPSIGEFTCEYSAQDLTKKIQIISKDFNKKTGFQMIFNDKVIGYTKELKFDKNSIFIIFRLQENINMDSMFKDVSSLVSISFTSAKDAKITSMISTFENCNHLENININGFNTENIKSMHKLFKRTNIQNLSMRKFNTKNVEDMSYMFAESNIKDIDFSSIDVRSVKNISHMFDNCYYLEKLDLSPFNINTNTKNVIYMSYMFY